MYPGRIYSLAAVVMLLLTVSKGQVDCSQCHTENEIFKLAKTMGLSEKAVGVMDKGQLQNNTSNFGDLASFHVWFTNAVHWPRTASDDRQYAFGLGLMVGINETNVIETVTQSQTRVEDWLPPDDAAGRHYSGDIRAASDQTPFQASSDYRETWPEGYYDDSGNWNTSSSRHWPGWFRIDLNHPDFPDSLVEKLNEFTSDRDIYSVFNDDYNSRGKVGIEVEQTAYSYGRPYAEDFVFWEFLIHNTSTRDLDDIYIGLLAKFRPDYDNHDYINLIDTDGDFEKDLIYVYDLNNERNKTWADTDAPLGMVGLRIYDTPENLGITDFHHFARGVSPLTDEEIWAIMSSDPDSPHLKDPDYYFHGSDPRVDYTGMDSLASFYPPWLDEESHVELEGDAINYIISCGPFTLEAGTSVPFSFGLIMGDAGTIPSHPDTTDLLSNVRLANTMYSLRFQGSGPPAPPTVEAIPGDQSALLYWISEPSESSIDVLTQARDFEGYKIFRSTDQGLTWGTAVTDAHGIQVGYEPIATFDLVNGVEGLDPAFPQYLGTNSGLVHTYKDSNLVNGLEYWYCVTAYDRGSQHPDSLEPSYMYPLGASDLEPHTVAVIPGGPAIDLTEAEVPKSSLAPIGGLCEGFARIEIIDPAAITGHGYKITFTEDAILSVEGSDTTWGIGTTGFTLVDTTEMDTLFFMHTLSDASGDNLPVKDGFRLVLQDTPSGVESYGWTKVNGDTSTFDWRFQSIDPGLGGMLVQEAVHTFDNWRITIDTTSGGGLDATWSDAFTGAIQETSQHLPLKVYVITDPDDPVDASEYTWQYDFVIGADWDAYRKFYYSPLGWDLIPGGKAFTEGSTKDGIWYEKHVDFLELAKPEIDPIAGDTSYSWIRMFTNHKPDTSITFTQDTLIIDAKAPSHGDEFTIITYKPFRPAISYTFGTTASSIAETEDDADPLGDVRVVPDPYIVTNAWETSEFGKLLQFTNLPSECTIRIFTLVGERVATIDHLSDRNYTFWDMRNHNDQFIAPGVYLYAITTPAGDKALGRFLVIK